MKARKLNKRPDGYYFKIGNCKYFYKSRTIFSWNSVNWEIIASNYEGIEKLFVNNYAIRAELSELMLPPCNVVMQF